MNTAVTFLSALEQLHHARTRRHHPPAGLPQCVEHDRLRAPGGGGARHHAVEPHFDAHREYPQCFGSAKGESRGSSVFCVQLSIISLRRSPTRKGWRGFFVSRFIIPPSPRQKIPPCPKPAPSPFSKPSLPSSSGVGHSSPPRSR